MKTGLRGRLQWFSMVDLERYKAHASLRSPELVTFSQMASGEHPKDPENGLDAELGVFVEICEDNLVICAETTEAVSSPTYQLLQAANYKKDEQIRMFREFLLSVYPALYMSPYAFTQFMMDLGWDRAQCSNLFRAADVTGRGGISFQEMLVWAAALEPATQHSGYAAEMRCRYIFRYFDANRDQKLEYTEFKELVAAARAARQLPVDALSVARDADGCLKQLGIQPNSPLPLAEFLRGVGELRLRGTSSLLRAPRSIAEYLTDLQERDQIVKTSPSSKLLTNIVSSGLEEVPIGFSPSPSSTRRREYRLADCVVRLVQKAPPEMIEISNFSGDAVSASTARMIAPSMHSVEVLGANSMPAEALAAVHYFAAAIDKPGHKRASTSPPFTAKPAWSWLAATEEAALGSLLLKLAEAVRPIFSSEPRLLKLNSPIYAIGDLHGNLSALLAMEAALWPAGAALLPARLLFLGDFVDRGAHGAEVVAYLLAAKLQRPRSVYLIRGNHETRDIQKMFTFHSECETKYGEVEGNKIWNAINQVFDVLPLAAVVDDKVFCCHGGIPPPWVCPLISAIDKIPVPLPRPAEQSSVAWELLWNDPIKPNKITASLSLELAANEGFAANARRGTGHVFEQAALDRFLLANGLSHVVRAHELQQAGFMCQLRGRLVSVFSSARYCGGSNDCGVALLHDATLRLIRLAAN
ncbi:uncharacterized protein [Epargyreus clarus]